MIKRGKHLVAVKKRTNNLCKIVYFDEESVTDYIQIIKGGTLEKTTELLKEGSDNGDAGVSAKAGIGIGTMLKALVGFDISSSVESSMHTSFSTQEMAKNIIKNTILTDFIDVLDDGSKGKKETNGTIRKFEEYKISVHKESLTYIALISPYLSMLKGGGGIPAGEFNIAVDKLDNTMKTAKGYYEFVGKKGKETVIFRFNIKSFKNNYKVTDLLKMDISIYAIKVGKTTIDKLNFNSELDIDHTTTIKDNPSYSEGSSINPYSDVDPTKPLDVFDVLLAGVESNG